MLGQLKGVGRPGRLAGASSSITFPPFGGKLRDAASSQESPEVGADKKKKGGKGEEENLTTVQEKLQGIDADLTG